MNECLFCKFVSKEFKTEIVYENKYVLAFNDIAPEAPYHILIIPKKHINSVSELKEEDSFLMGKLYLAAQEIAKQISIKDYKLIINNGKGAGQTVFHLHLHLLGGKNFNE